MGKQDKPRNDLMRMGIFSEPTYISVGEPYNSKKTMTLDFRAAGKQFLTAPAHHGQNPDAYFDHHFVRLFEVIEK
jgi:hypothetical protein